MFDVSNQFASSHGQKRSFTKVMLEINTEISSVHKSIKNNIDTERYFAATQFAEQYISYTTIWNLKFTYNMENPEVALIQLMHLEYILDREPAESFEKERQILRAMQQLFNAYKPYSNDMLQQRKIKMQHFIDGHI